MGRFDARAAQKLADGFMRQASTVVFICTAVGILVGFGSGGAVAGSMHRPSPTNAYLVIGVITVIGAVVGYLIGATKAMNLRAIGTMLMCCSQIEANTNKTAEEFAANLNAVE